MTHRKINTPPGPEDIIPDLHHGAFRLLLSCTDRHRKANGKQNGIYALEPVSGDYKKLYPLNDTDYAGEIFAPHGFDLVRYNDGSIHVLVISHTRDADKNTRHEILDLRFNGADALERVAVHHGNPLIHNPNDVAGLPDGRFYFTNSPDIDHLEFASPEESVVYYRKETGFKTVGFNLRFANGIATNGTHLLVSAVMDDKIIVSEIHGDNLVMEPQSISTGKGMDNIRFDTGTIAYAPAHTSMGKYMMYAVAQSTGIHILKSPIAVNRLDFTTRTCETLFQHNGSVISGVSSVVKHGDKLYLSQVFDPFIVELSPDAAGRYSLDV